MTNETQKIIDELEREHDLIRNLEFEYYAMLAAHPENYFRLIVP